MTEITESPIDHAAITDRVRSNLAGAVCTFLGTVREMTGDPVGVASAECVDPTDEDELEVLVGPGHGRFSSSSPSGLFLSPRIWKVARGQRLCSRFESSGASCSSIAAS